MGGVEGACGHACWTKRSISRLQQKNQNKTRKKWREKKEKKKWGVRVGSNLPGKKSLFSRCVMHVMRIHIFNFFFFY